MILLFNKPMNVLSQFTDEGKWPGLKHYIDQKGVYAAGRLDRDSEGHRITLAEGRNRQVRRMTAAVGHPTLRLVREAIGPWELGRLQPGDWITTDVRP